MTPIATPPVETKLLRPEEAGALVGRSARTLLNWERRGLLTGRRCEVSGRVFYPADQVAAIAQRLREAAR